MPWHLLKERHSNARRPFPGQATSNLLRHSDHRLVNSLLLIGHMTWSTDLYWHLRINMIDIEEAPSRYPRVANRVNYR